MAEPSSSSGVPDLPHLGTFAQAAELGSFTAAAVELGVSQLAVSQRIAALKRQLKVSLFQWRAGKVYLTELGSRWMIRSCFKLTFQKSIVLLYSILPGLALRAG